MKAEPEASPSGRSFRRILVATDLTPRSKKAFRQALALARDLGARIELLHVWSVPRTRALFFMNAAAGTSSALQARHREKTTRRFGDFLRGEDLGGVDLSTVFLEGVPHEEIVRYAKTGAADLIVVGERHETRAQHLLQHLAFEGVGEHVRRTSPCPVLTVR